MKCPTCNQELPQLPESMKDKAHLLNALVTEAERIRDSGIEWDVIYNLIFFSSGISLQINVLMNELNISTSYYDPDTTYEEDVRAYVSDRREKVDDLMMALGMKE